MTPTVTFSMPHAAAAGYARRSRCDHASVSEWFRSYGFVDVYDGLLVGALPLDESDVRRLVSLGVTRVLNLVEDREYVPTSRARVEAALEHAGVVEQRLGSEDHGRLSEQLLEDASQLLNGWLDEGRTIYLHCRAGRQRSAAVAAAALARRERIDPEIALRRIQTRKPSALPLPPQLADLQAWWRTRASADARPPLS